MGSSHTVDLRTEADTEGGSSQPGRPSPPSDPWEADWHQPDRRDLERKHARIPETARQRHRAADAVPSVARGRRVRSAARRLLGIGALASSAYWYFALATLVLALGIPLVSGWSSAAVVTGSMEPVISAGDVVSFSAYDGSPLTAGTIIRFHDPARPDETTTHRVVALNPDGTYTTRGDANGSNDSSPVQPEDIIGVARMVTPHAALPHVWWKTGRPWVVLAWFTATIGAALLMRGHARHERRDRIPSRRPNHAVGPAIAMLAITVAAGVGVAARAQARFTSTSATPGSHLVAAADFTPFEHLGTVGRTTCSTATSSSLSVATPVPAGSTIVVRFTLRDLTSAAAYGATDSAGNTYTVDAQAADAVRTETAVLSAFVGSQLDVGDQITVTHPSGRATAVSADVFAGVAPADRVITVATGTGNDATPSIAATPGEGPGLAIGQIAVRNTTSVASPAASWTALASGAVACDRAATDRGAWRQTVPGALTYDPTFGSKERWSGVVVVYRTG